MAGVSGRSGGHNAKPVVQHGLEGTLRKDRHAAIRNPEPESGIPISPKPLTGDARDEWDRMIERLTDCKTLAKVDSAALFQYCCLFAETEALVIDLETARGSVLILEENIRGLKGPDLVAVFQEIGKLRHDIKGYATSIRQGRMAQRVFLVEFGLTPASRGRVKLPAKPDVDPFAEFDDTHTVQ